MLYNTACLEAIVGEPEAAIDHLQRSIALEERFRDFARTDEDFASIRDRTDFRELVGEGA